MFLIGPILIGVGFIILYVGIYQRNTVQGAVSETSPVFLVVFGLMDWKNNKLSISLILFGVVLTVVSIFT